MKFMKLIIPSFWYHRSAISTLLLPLSWLYGLIHRLKYYQTQTWVASRPVICVGNLVLGGAGKTPLVLSIARKLQAHGVQVAILSRGYLGNISKATQVEIDYHSARDVGDEALMIAQYFPCFVGRNKVATAKLAIETGADILLMDDGFQNNSLYQNLRIIVIDGQHGFGNNLRFPAGPMREKISALQRASWVVLLGEDQHKIFSKVQDYGIDLLRARAVPVATSIEAYDWLAFAGIGVPEKFFQHLTLSGFKIKRMRKFPNHHLITHVEMMDLFAEARQHKLKLITTEKDWVRIPQVFRNKVHCHHIDMAWEQEDEINKRLANFIYYTDCIV